MKEEEEEDYLKLKTAPSMKSEANDLESKPFLHEDDQFDKSLLELKDLRSQLHYAANYCQVSFLKSEEKNMVMENTKEYICRALVTVVDHLGSVSTNLEGQLLRTNEFADTEVRMSCLQQRLLTCQEYVQRLNISKLCWNGNIPRHHTRYISLPTAVLEEPNSVSREVDDSAVPKTMRKHSLDAAEKEMPLFLYTYDHKPSLTNLRLADINYVKKHSRDPSSELKFPAVLPVREPFLISIPRNPSFHFQNSKKAGQNEKSRRLLQLPWRKSYRMH